MVIMFAILEAKHASLLSSNALDEQHPSTCDRRRGCVATSNGFAIASGAKPEQGIYTAIAAGGLASLVVGKVPFIYATGMPM